MRFLNSNDQRLPIPTRVDRPDSRSVASKAMPSFFTMESTSRAMLMEQPRTDRNDNGPRARALTWLVDESSNFSLNRV